MQLDTRGRLLAAEVARVFHAATALAELAQWDLDIPQGIREHVANIDADCHRHYEEHEAVAAWLVREQLAYVHNGYIHMAEIGDTY